MSQSPPNYMEGVPVKISEKYKPPPKVFLPLSVTQRLSIDEIPSSLLDYDFSLEHSVIAKINEWKKVRENQIEARRERMRKAEDVRLRQIEEKQKQLLTAVSYPSTEDLSSDGDDDGSTPSDKTVTHAVVQFSPSQQRFDTILTPTIVPDTSNQVNCNQMKGTLSNINYSDFENDTSSPFDSVELKTINELDILAQVLNVTQLHSVKEVKDEEDNATEQNTNGPDNASEVSTDQIMASDNRRDNIESTSNITACNFSQNPNNYNSSYNQQTIITPNYENMNGIVKHNNIYYFNQMASNQNYDNYMYNYNTIPDQANFNIQNNHHNPHHHNNQQTTYSPTVFNNYTTVPVDNVQSGNLHVKSKSKSVPDILKELNDDVRDSEIRRARTNRQTQDNEEKNQTNPNGMDKIQEEEIFMKLSPSSQLLAKNISLMGFPLDRVSRIAEKFGNDDKKIVEHLIPLSELLDLGFEESRISEALLKFNNNKEKALDYLIS